MPDFLEGIRRFREFLLEIGAAQTTLLLPSPRMLALPPPEEGADPQQLFSRLVVEPEIVEVSRDLFASGHFSIAIQEACKALEKFLQAKSGSGQAGTTLMDQVFSPNSPLLYWTTRATPSEKDEQLGYHRIYSGTMLGIRNPCAHEFNWVDDPEVALEIMILVQHLLRKAKLAVAVPKAATPALTTA